MAGSSVQTPELEPYLGVFRGVALAQEEWASDVRRGEPAPRLSEDVVRARLGVGLPLVRGEEMAGWTPRLVALGEALCGALASLEGTRALATGLRQAFQTGQMAAARLAAAALADSSDLLSAWAEESGIDHQQLAFVAASLAGPPVRLMAEEWLASLGPQPVGPCPVCGHEPLLARLDGKSGSRWLICSLCSSQYRVPRLGCPFCGNSASDSLGYLSPVEGPPEWRIDYCDGCGRYLKTIDERRSGEGVAEPFTSVDAATHYLDVLARSEGYGVQARAVATEQT